MTTGNRIGKVEIPWTLAGFSDGAPDSGLGAVAFKAEGFDTFKVEFPRRSETSSNDIAAFLLEEAFWNGRIVTDNGAEPSTLCSLPEISLGPSSTLPISSGGVGCAPPSYSSPVKFDLLFGVCNCNPNAPGCFHRDVVNPAVIVPNATVQNCPRGNIGSVIIPVYPLLGPRGATTLPLTQYVDDCVYDYDVVEPPGIHTADCNICDADRCVPDTSGVGGAVAMGRRAGGGATTASLYNPAEVSSEVEDEPLSLPAVIAIVSIGSISGLVILWFQFKRRLG